MKTIWMLAAKYLRRNPKRTGIMVICMSLVVMMITVITVFAFSYQHHIKQKIIQEDGNWHVEFHDLTEKQAEALQNHSAVKRVEKRTKISNEVNDLFDQQTDRICMSVELKHVNFMIERKTAKIAEEIRMERESGEEYSRPDAMYNVSYHTDLLGVEGINIETMEKGQAFVFLVVIVIVIGSVFMYYAVNSAWDEHLHFIGMLGSVGASAKQKQRVIYAEGFLTGILGAVIGFLMGILFLTIGMRKLSYFLWGEEIVKIRFSVWEAFIILGAVVFILLISCSSSANAAKEIGVMDLLAKNSMQDVEAKKVFLLTKKKAFVSTEVTMALKNIAVYHKKYHSSCILLVMVLCIILDGYVYARAAAGEYNFEMKQQTLPNVSVTGFISQQERNVSEYLSAVRALPEVESATIQKVMWCFGGFEKMDTVITGMDENGNATERTIKQYSKPIQLTGLDEETYQMYAEREGASKEEEQGAFAIVDSSKALSGQKEILYLLDDSARESGDYTDDPDGLPLRVLTVTENPIPILEPRILNADIKDISYNKLLGWVGECIRVYVPMGLFDELGKQLMSEQNAYYPQIIDICMKGNRETLISQQQFLFQKNIGKRIKEEQCLIEQIDRLGDTYLDDNVELYSVARSQIQRFIDNPDETMFLFAKVLAVTVSIFAVISILQKISSTIRLRKKEFALLQAMGMTKTRIYRMILLEHSIYGIVGLFIGIPLSLFLMAQIFAEFEIPFAEITKEMIPYRVIGVQLFLIGFVIVVPFLHTILTMRKIDMIEVIRSENQ